MHDPTARPFGTTLTLAERIDRNNREVRMRRLIGTAERLSLLVLYSFAMFCLAVTLAVAIAERIL